MLQSLRRLLPDLRRYRSRYALGAVCVVVTVALRFLIPYLLGDSIDSLRSEDGGLPTGSERDDVFERIVTAAVWIVLAACVGATIRTISRLMILGNSRAAVHDVREDVFAHLLRLEPSFYVRHRTGHIMSRAVNDMQNVQGLLGPVFMYLVETAVLYAVGITFLLAAHPWVGLVGLAPFPVFLVLARRLARQVQEGSRAAQERLGELSAKVDESLSGHAVVKSLVLQDYDFGRFESLCRDYAACMIGVARVRAWLSSSMTFLAALSTFAVLAVGAPLVRSGSVTVGEMVAMILYLGMLAAPTRTLGFVLSSLQRGAAALDRVGELLDMPVAIANRAGGPAEHVDFEIDSGAIEVRGLTLDFPSAVDLPHLSGSLPTAAAGSQDRTSGAGDGSGDRRVLDDVSLTIPAGSTIGIVGPVGSGKSTLLRVLMRQLEIPSGTVFIDGHDLTEIPLAEVRRKVGLAPQDAFLFGETLENNVRFGAPDADRDEVLRAAEIAQLTGDLEQLPDGVETMLGERGVNLSGGQRQRTSLARVALVKPTILLLDDTLSAIDAGTSERILQRLRPVMQGRTTIVVAHRMQTVQDADRICVLDEGRVTESGTHAELLERDGFYARTFRQQSARDGLARELGIEAEARG